MGQSPHDRAALGYLEWSVEEPLRRFVSCTWMAGKAREPAVMREPVLPDAAMDIIWDGARLFVAGPDSGPVAEESSGPVVGIRFRPGMGPLLLGVRANELLDLRIDLDLLWPDAASVVDRLSESISARGAAAVLEQAVASRLLSGTGASSFATPDPIVESAARLWRVQPDRLSAAGIAERAGLSERQVHRRFVAAVGYGPKMLQRVLRLQVFLAAAAEPLSGSLGDLAYRAGYADQAHLCRETAVLAGRTPAELRAARRGRREDEAAERDAAGPE